MMNAKLAEFLLILVITCAVSLTVDAFVVVAPQPAQPRVFAIPASRRSRIMTTTLKVTTTSDDEEAVRTDDEYQQQQKQNDNPIQQFVHRFLAAGGGNEEEIGERGEMYFFLQAIPIVGIGLGGIPVLSDALRFMAGPGLLLLGIALMALTALDMGDALTPWPKPNGEGLVTTGLYGQVRHPMYAGLLSSLVGFSIWTQSVDRILLVALLIVALDIKSDYEERELTKAYPDYPQYQEKVTSKFVPKSLLEMRRRKKKKEKVLMVEL